MLKMQHCNTTHMLTLGLDVEHSGRALQNAVFTFAFHLQKLVVRSNTWRACFVFHIDNNNLSSHTVDGD